MKKLLGIGILMLLSGCTSPKYNYMPSTQNISEPPQGSVNTVYVGDSLLRQGVIAKYEGLKVIAPAKVSWAYTVTPGYLKKVGEDSKAEFYLPTGTPESANVDKAALADMWQGIMAKKGTKTLCVITVFSATTCEDDMPFEHTNLNVSSDSSFQQALLYNGRVGNKINIGYRESSGNMARPAFNNDVEYDLSESKTIGYKGARIEVIDATNQSIKYRVISNFN
ncbi:hypothetical protein [Erwinia phyllosphaerae]|uniref:hypothetical protein n=1 Tax=Erwinia phyllosphaerae TaxID=2853256 RepID=UPI001FEE2708|nr:hypothetical protein [Erwinia phyllosphaerae]MBV4366295.1 hypothetical protein [Erwinia phyllosphaerae]